MRKLGMLAAALLVVAAWVAPGQAVVYTLFESALNEDGGISTPSVSLPGSLSVNVSGAGAHYVALFVDYEIDELVNTFFIF